MSRNGHSPEYTRKSEQQLNAEALARRGIDYPALYASSLKRKEERAATMSRRRTG